jgi:hypothetical protein
VLSTFRVGFCAFHPISPFVVAVLGMYLVMESLHHCIFRLEANGKKT